MNGTHYDIMGLDKNGMFVNKQFINKLTRNPSRLISAYQQVCSQKLFSHFKPPKDVVLDEMKTPLKNIANDVIRELSAHIDKNLVHAPTNLKDLYNIITGDDVEAITSKIIIQSYEDLKESSGNAELSSTFLFNSDYVMKLFVKSVGELFAKSKLSEFMFKEKTPDALIVYTRKILSDIIKKSSTFAFDPNNDIYENLMVKKSLLKIEL